MVTVRQVEEKNDFARKLFQDTKVPVYHVGTQSLANNILFGEFLLMCEEEQTLLDALLLAQWEDRLWKSHFRYDVTASEVKVISGKIKFLAQLNFGWNHLKDPEELKMSHESKMSCESKLSALDSMKHHEELLFCIASSDQAYADLIPSAAVPNAAILVIINVKPVEYGHVFLVPHGFNSLYQVPDAEFLEMVARIAVEMNNCSFRMFYDSARPSGLHQHFQAWYFPDLLPVECMPVDTLFSDRQNGVCISVILDYPIKTLLFERNCNLKMLFEVLSETCSFLLEKSIPYSMLISDRGKKTFLFLQTLSTSCALSAWECGGYFPFRSRTEFDHVTEPVLLRRLRTVSIDDDGFAVVKQQVCNIASKLVS